MNKNKGFTLAEVLVTLMLIGVVAALTIPFLVSEINRDKWTVSYKRSFAETYNALGELALEEDCSKSLTCTHIFEGTQPESIKKFGDGLTKIMAVAKNCGTDNNGCFSHNVKKGLNSTTEESLATTMFSDTNIAEQDFYTFTTTRGVSYALYSFGNSCGTTADNTFVPSYVRHPDSADNPMINLCGFMIIDVNAQASPNIWGRDVFGIWITDRDVIGVYPFGGQYDLKFNYKNDDSVNNTTEFVHCTNNDASSSDSDNRGCAARLIDDGWKMTY